MIDKLLRGKNKRSQDRLDALSNALGKNPNILWYPSAGNDFRDVLEFTNERSQLHKISELPDLFIHTDYGINLNQLGHTDNRTNVRIDNKYELQLQTNIEYNIDPHFVDSPEIAPMDPTIYLLDVTVVSDSLGEVKQTVIYFIFENINFLDEVVLKNKISISHLIKVREGCGFGGNRKSISVAYAFLSLLKTKYLIVDTEEHTDFKIIHRLKTKHNISPLVYDLDKQHLINSWSGFNVNVFSVSYRQQQLDDVGLKQVLNTITRTNSKNFTSNGGSIFCSKVSTEIPHLTTSNPLLTM